MTCMHTVQSGDEVTACTKPHDPQFKFIYQNYTYEACSRAHQNILMAECYERYQAKRHKKMEA